MSETAGAPAPFKLDDEAIALLKKTECKGWSPEQFDLFKYQCDRTGLNPLTRQIYGQLRWDKNVRDDKGKKVGGNKLSVQTSIDGFRLVAQRTKEYQGQVGPYWCGDDGEWKDVWLGKTPPSAAKVGVWRTGFREPTWGVANFDAYAQTFSRDDGTTVLSGLWAKMAETMIAKCAEALALRKAFPQELSGIYTSDEMAQASEDKAPEQSDEDAAAERAKKSAQTDIPGAQSAHEPAPAKPAPQSKGLAGSKTGARRVSGTSVEEDRAAKANPNDRTVVVPVDEWQAEDLRKLPTLGGKTLGQLPADSLKKMVALGDKYIEQGQKMEEAGKVKDGAAIALQALEGVKALLKYEGGDEIP